MTIEFEDLQSIDHPSYNWYAVGDYGIVAGHVSRKGSEAFAKGASRILGPLEVHSRNELIEAGYDPKNNANWMGATENADNELFPRDDSDDGRVKNPIDNPDYNWYVVNERGIITGNEYKEDAKDALLDMPEHDGPYKVYSRRFLTTNGFNPSDDKSWTSSRSDPWGFRSPRDRDTFGYRKPRKR